MKRTIAAIIMAMFVMTQTGISYALRTEAKAEAAGNGADLKGALITAATPAPSTSSGQAPAAWIRVISEINKIKRVAKEVKDRYASEGIANWIPSMVEMASAVLLDIPSERIKDLVTLFDYFIIRTSEDKLQVYKLTDSHRTMTLLYATFSIKELQQKPIGKTALVIDNKQERRERLAGILSQTGFIVTAVESIFEAKEKYTGTPDVVINNIGSRTPYEGMDVLGISDYNSVIQLRDARLDSEAIRFRVLSVLVATQA